MSHQDFEKYATQRPMNGVISEVTDSFFEANVLPFLQSRSKVLDFGCGDGKYFAYFSGIVSPGNVSGVDVSETRVQRCQALGWQNAVKIEPLQPLPFPDSHFTFINCDQVLEHIRLESIPFYLKEMKRVLANDGFAFFVTPNYPIKRFYDFCNAFQKKEIARLYDDPTHVTKFNFRLLEHVLAELFASVRLYPTGGFLYDSLRKPWFSHKIQALVRKQEVTG